MGERVLVPGGRDVRGSLDTPDRDGETNAASDTCIVACPPHPQNGGSRRDGRLGAVSGTLRDREIDCLRFDYGPWDGGRGEQTDTRNAIDWATDRYEHVGLFGYSFGATVALAVAADLEGLACVSVLAPAARIGEHLDAVAGVGQIEAPLQVVVGESDETVAWQPVVEEAAKRGSIVERLAADHFFLGTRNDAAERVAAFVVEHVP